MKVIDKAAVGIISLALILSAGTSVQGQETKKETHQKDRTLTGCLTKGSDTNEYKLTAEDGGKWDLKSDSVKLAPHVGHTVTVTGVVSNATAHGAKEDLKDEAQEHGLSKSSTETGDLSVTTLKMVNSSCQK